MGRFSLKCVKTRVSVSCRGSKSRRLGRWCQPWRVDRDPLSVETKRRRETVEVGDVTHLPPTSSTPRLPERPRTLWLSRKSVLGVKVSETRCPSCPWSVLVTGGDDLLDLIFVAAPVTSRIWGLFQFHRSTGGVKSHERSGCTIKPVGFYRFRPRPLRVSRNLPTTNSLPLPNLP